MTQAFENVFGITVYCEKHGQGAIVFNIPTLQPSGLPYNNKYHIKGRYSLLNCFDGNKICCSDGSCCWEQHGKATLKNNLLKFTSLTNRRYDDHCDGWKIDYFKKNIYDQFGNDISDYNFVVCHCDEINSEV
jgi:hypothetical protein